MIKSLYIWSVGFYLVALTGCASSPPPMEELGPQPERTIQPGDLVKLVVWREEDMSGEFMVNPAGEVILPRVGKWDVRAETEASLEERLREGLGRELRNPSIDVIVLRRIKVLGAVNEPGLYPLDNTMTLSDALATAGGVDPTGQHDRIELRRGDERYTIRTKEDRRLSELPLRSGDELYVPRQSWFLRNSGAVVTAVSSATGLIILLLTNRDRGSESPSAAPVPAR